MVFELKDYQRDCLDRLTAYLKKARELGDPDTAFYGQTRRQFQSAPKLGGLPYVCLRVPTGGGKTALAAYAAQPMVEHWLQAERGVVLWLAPSSTIVDQTLKALRDRQHPYRKALARLGEVTIVDRGAGLARGPAPYASGTVVLVTTVQSLRQEDPKNLRVYRDDNGALMEHFTRLGDDLKRQLLARAPGGEDVTLPSLRNVLRMHRPLVVVDEAHNVRSDLSFETLARFDPSAILEITATPARDSNVLHAVSAAELKAEQMIKLPVELYRRDQGKDSIAQAVAKRDELEELAKQDQAAGREYVRPIVLYHAETKGGDLTPEKLKDVLVKDLKIPKEQVAIETGTTRELPEAPILSKANPVRHVITIQALREGWDCSFAYILCSVSSLSAKTAVEQLLGRVLRMPRAADRGIDALNRAYCYATGQTLATALEQLEEAIVESGFTRYEAKRAVVAKAEGGSGLFGQQAEPVSVTLAGPFDAGVVKALPEAERGCIRVKTTDTGTELVWEGPAMSEAASAVLAGAAEQASDQKQVKRLARLSAGESASPAAMNETFKVPGLAVADDDGQPVLLDDQPLEAQWDLSACDATLADSAFPLKAEKAQGAALDVDEKGELKTRQIDVLDQQLTLLEHDAPQSPQELAVWLDQAIRDPFIVQAQKKAFLHTLVADQVERRGIELATLVRHRHRLKDAAAAKIAAHRLHAEAQEYQRLLEFATTDLTCCISFPHAYPANEFYTGSFQFQKHFYSDVGAMNKAELAVAKYLDQLPQVVHWVRNLEKPGYGFWLPLAHGRFYPDFVAELVGEAYLVVEYKGEHLEAGADQQAKKAAGELWAAGSPGDLGFVWALADDWRATIDAAVARL